MIEACFEVIHFSQVEHCSTVQLEFTFAGELNYPVSDSLGIELSYYRPIGLRPARAVAMRRFVDSLIRDNI
jgi:hypothetical protein